ncbi:MAG: hypothetical protein WCP98_15060 [Actinomycetes bacterium]
MSTQTLSVMARDFGAVTVGQNGRSLQFAFVDVSPALALTWLNMEHPDNRRSTKQRVEDYGLTMSAGHWNALTAECLKFDILGQLIDGGHRLRGVLMSGDTVTMLVAWGLPIEAYHIIDQGRPRMKLWWESSDIRAAVQALASYRNGAYTTHKMSLERTTSMLENHRAALVFACDLCAAKQTGMTAAFRAIIARASYHEDPAILSEFTQCLYAKRLASTDRRQFLISKFSKFQMSSTSQQSQANSETRTSRYLKTEWALQAFINDHPVTRLCTAQKELFLIEEDAS